MQRKLFGTASAVAFVFSGALITPTLAQNADEGLLEEIIVTATKREENVQRVPISLSTITGEKLDVITSGGVDIRFLSARVPSLLAESSFGRSQPRFFIRGVGNIDFDLNASQPISIIYDEVVFENSALKGFPAFDLERVEVLRGPQGTLFGRNTPGGIIKFDSKKPTQEVEGYARLSYGRFDTTTFEGAIGGGLIDGILSARLSIQYQRRADWVTNTFAEGALTGDGQFADQKLGGYSDVAGRMQILFEPNENFSALLNVHARSLRGTARLFRAGSIAAGGGPAPGLRRDEVSHDSPNEQELNSLGVTLKMEYDFSNLTLTSVTGIETMDIFSRGDVDGGSGLGFFAGATGLPLSGPEGILFGVSTADGIPDLDQVTQEIRLSSDGWDRFNFQVGFFYFNEDVRIENFVFTGGASNDLGSFNINDQTTKDWALFGTVTYDVSEDFQIRSGLRYTEVDKELVADGVLFAGFFNPFIDFPEISASTSDSKLSYDFTATYFASDDVNVYGRFAHSFRAPSLRGRSVGAITQADAETIDSFEAGIKSELLDRSLRLNLNVFYFNYSDIQIGAVDPNSPTGNIIFQNAKKAIGYGLEADIDWAVNENLLITFGGSYNFNEFKDPGLEVEARSPLIATVLDPMGTGVGPFGPVPTAFIDGNRLPRSPKWIASWTLRYGMPLDNGDEVFFYTDWRYNSTYNFELEDTLEFKDDLFEGGVRLGYLRGDGRYEAAFFVRNVLNHLAINGALTFTSRTGFINEPRTWGVELKANF